LSGAVCARQDKDAQEKMIQAKYFESADRTEVSTVALPLKREQAQMLEVAFYAGYPTARLSAPPDIVILRFLSFGHTLLYQQPEQRALTVTTDGESWRPAQPLGYAPLTPEFKREKSKKDDPAPDRADFRFMEVMNARISFDQLTRIARAQQVRMQLGAAEAVIDPRLMKIVRDFVARVTPGEIADAAPPPTRVPKPLKWSDEPSRFANATLQDALSFLKQELIANTAGQDGYVNRFEAANFSGCKIKYRIVPVMPPDPPGQTYRRDNIPASNEYAFNLADLDPASVQVNKEGTSISFDTLNHQPKIKRLYRSNYDTRLTSVPQEIDEQSEFLFLRPTKTAPQIGHALVRAIRLCQEPQP
jgi:hypothetical protein